MGQGVILMHEGEYYHHNLSANCPVAEMIICLLRAVTCGSDRQSIINRSNTAWT